MKKIILFIILAIVAIGAEAQTTWNIRVGSGMATADWGPDGSFVVMGQSNIPFKRGGKWTFSPSLNYAFGAGEEGGGHHITMPLEFGRKVLTKRNNIIFFPKFGLVVGGYVDEYCGTGIFGPSFSLDTEIKHFVFGVGIHYSGIPRFEYDDYSDDTEYFDVMSFQVTIGYKF